MIQNSSNPSITKVKSLKVRKNSQFDKIRGNVLKNQIPILEKNNKSLMPEIIRDDQLLMQMPSKFKSQVQEDSNFLTTPRHTCKSKKSKIPKLSITNTPINIIKAKKKNLPKLKKSSIKQRKLPSHKLGSDDSVRISYDSGKGFDNDQSISIGVLESKRTIKAPSIIDRSML